MKEKKKILIVEDDKLLALVKTRLVVKLGFVVTGAVETGMEAINQVLTNRT